MPIRILDIAKAAGVSPATVARVVNENGYVSQAKRRQVQQAIDELGYVPNKIASGLRTQKRHFIGHVVQLSVENPFFARICNAVNDTAERAGYHVLTASNQMDAQKERAVLENLMGLMVDAIVFTGNTASDADTIRWIQSRGIPVVMIERPQPGSRVDAVLLDSQQGASAAAEHILGKGHRDIGFLGAQYAQHEVEYQRYHGFCEGMKAGGVKVKKEWVRFVPDYTVEDGRQAMKELLALRRRPTALFVTSDVVVCGALQVLYKQGLRVPEDMSIVGFDNTLSSLCTPQLTSMEMQLEQAGATAVEMVLERTKGSRLGAKTVTLSPVLIDRGSVRTMP